MSVEPLKTWLAEVASGHLFASQFNQDELVSVSSNRLAAIAFRRRESLLLTPRGLNSERTACIFPPSVSLYATNFSEMYTIGIACHYWFCKLKEKHIFPIKGIYIGDKNMSKQHSKFWCEIFEWMLLLLSYIASVLPPLWVTFLLCVVHSNKTLRDKKKTKLKSLKCLLMTMPWLHVTKYRSSSGQKNENSHLTSLLSSFSS